MAIVDSEAQASVRMFSALETIIFGSCLLCQSFFFFFGVVLLDKFS